MLRIVSFRIEPVARARQRRLVSLAQPRGERREALDPLVAARGPAALEDDDHAWRARVEVADELRAQRAHHRRVLVVEEVEVVEEARGLAHAEAEERVEAALGGAEPLPGVAGRQPRAQDGLEPAHGPPAVPPPPARCPPD